MSQPAYSGPALYIRHTGQVFPLTQAAITIGRHADNTIVLSDPQVSRHHATITWQPSGYAVQDLNSANGTFVNEQPVGQPSVLRDGDTLRGDYQPGRPGRQRSGGVLRPGESPGAAHHTP